MIRDSVNESDVDDKNDEIIIRLAVFGLLGIQTILNNPQDQDSIARKNIMLHRRYKNIEEKK